MNSAAIATPSIAFGSPGDRKEWWLAQWADFLVILHEACDPDGMENWIERRIDTYKLGRWTA